MLTHEKEQANCKICSFMFEEVSSRIISHSSLKIKKKNNRKKTEKIFSQVVISRLQEGA